MRTEVITIANTALLRYIDLFKI